LTIREKTKLVGVNSGSVLADRHGQHEETAQSGQDKSYPRLSLRRLERSLRMKPSIETAQSVEIHG